MRKKIAQVMRKVKAKANQRKVAKVIKVKVKACKKKENKVRILKLRIMRKKVWTEILFNKLNSKIKYYKINTS